MLLFTDGLFEVQHSDGSYFNEEGLLAAVRKRIQHPPPRLLEELLAEARNHAATGCLDDDVCLLAMELRG